jgi:hypothetical protein
MGWVAANFNFAGRFLRLGPKPFDRQQAVLEGSTPNFDAFGQHEDALVQKVPCPGLVPARNNELMARDRDFKIMKSKPGNGQNDPQECSSLDESRSMS